MDTTASKTECKTFADIVDTMSPHALLSGSLERYTAKKRRQFADDPELAIYFNGNSAEVFKWLELHCQEKSILHDWARVVEFRSKQDALLFRLRWS
jgi:hypothetical protein